MSELKPVLHPCAMLRLDSFYLKGTAFLVSARRCFFSRALRVGITDSHATTDDKKDIFTDRKQF